jgi:hypothetical protein
LRDGLQHPFPGALVASIVPIALIALTASVWYKGIGRLCRHASVGP